MTEPRERVPSAVWLIVLAVVAATPLIMSLVTRDVYRLPKQAFFEAGMLAAGAVAAAWFLIADWQPRRLAAARVELLLAAAIVAWTAIVSMTAVNPAVSHHAPLAAFCYALLFVLTLAVARWSPLVALGALLLPAAANAVIVLLQAARVWSPVPMMEGRLANIGMLGNPNYAGTYLVVPAVAAIAGAIALRRHRLLLAPVALLLLVAVVAVQTVTALVAMGAAMVCFAAVTRAKRVRLAIAAVALLGAIGVLAYAPTRARLVSMAGFARGGQTVELTSARLPAYAVAARMFADRPVVGGGPGSFGARYMPYKLRIDEKYPQWIRLENHNFGEVHNDHLQLLAETGLPGYLLFLAALIRIAALSFRKREEGHERGRFVRLFAFPAVVGLAVAALAQFPLHLTAVASGAVFMAGVCVAWKIDREVAS